MAKKWRTVIMGRTIRTGGKDYRVWRERQERRGQRNLKLRFSKHRPFDQRGRLFRREQLSKSRIAGVDRKNYFRRRNNLFRKR